MSINLICAGLALSLLFVPNIHTQPIAAQTTSMQDVVNRAVRDMIVDSSNEATQYVLDVITHTTSGYELPPKEMEEWQYKRNAVNRYFSSLGYTNINVNQKTHC